MPNLQPLTSDDVVYAGFLRRWAALFLDSLIVSSAFYAVCFIVLLVVLGLTGLDVRKDEDPSAWMIGAYLGLSALYFVMAGLYFALMESSVNQATLGKMALGIKVTDRDGQRLSLTHALGRWAAAALSYITLYIGFIMAGFTQRKQALHDLAAGTLVVDKWAWTDTPERQQRELSGCLVAFLIGIGLMIIVAVLGILAAIAIPAYSDYTQRAKVSAAIHTAAPLRLLVAEAAMADGGCPGNDSPGFRPSEAYAAAQVSRIEIGEQEDGECGIVIWLADGVHTDPEQAWITLSFAAEEQRWRCVSGLPDRALPASCRD